jgi:hypothetical protein
MSMAAMIAGTRVGRKALPAFQVGSDPDREMRGEPGKDRKKKEQDGKRLRQWSVGTYAASKKGRTTEKRAETLSLLQRIASTVRST